MPQPLASKERTLFAQVVKNYENKQYKKGLKAAEQVLRKNPNHGDTQAMKALITNSLGQSEDAFALAKVALKNDMKSHVCWHVYGLLYRAAKNFEESIKAYKFALRLEPESVQIQRDLALLQVQMRDYAGYVQSRRAMLQARPAVRGNWTALAIAQHLSGDLEDAERTLTAYEETLKSPPPKSDIEHQETTLYKNTIVAEMGQTEKALEHLNAAAKQSYDKQRVMEMRAAYLLKLERRKEAEDVYRSLLNRNADNRVYYEGLQAALGIETSDTAKLKELYSNLAEKWQKADAPRRIPLEFLDGDDFKQAADAYLRLMLTKGVPSTFANVKTLYTDPKKRDTVQALVESYANDGITSHVYGTEGSDKKDGKMSQFEDSVQFFLAQHYNYYKSRDLSKAMETINRLIEKSPKSVDYHMIRARIFKHHGDIRKASEVMEYARSLDERDRYINTKAAKYQLRNDENAAALTNISKFTRNETVGGPLGDLTDMQCIWFLWEESQSFLRQSKLGPALKRLTSIYNIFEIWQEDQFDFHSYSVRKGQIRAYIDLIRFEDHLRSHPFFSRTAISAIKTYMLLHDHPELVHGKQANGVNGSETDASAQKKAARKAKKAQEKQEQLEAERKDAKKTNGTGADGESKKEDKDPEGKLLVATTEPLKMAMKFLTPILELSPKSIEAQSAGFELYLRRKKYALALRCLLASSGLNPPPPSVHSQTLRIAHALATLPSPLPLTLAKSFQDALQPLLPANLSSLNRPIQVSDLSTANDSFLERNQDDGLASLAAAWEVRLAIERSKENKESAARELAAAVATREGIQMEDAQALLRDCREWGVAPAPVLAAARKRWPKASLFEEETA